MSDIVETFVLLSMMGGWRFHIGVDKDIYPPNAYSRIVPTKAGNPLCNNLGYWVKVNRSPKGAAICKSCEKRLKVLGLTMPAS